MAWRRPVNVELTWSEAANLLAAAAAVDTTGWTPAAKGNLSRALDKLTARVAPMDDPNAMFLVVRGQTTVRVEPSGLVPEKPHARDEGCTCQFGACDVHPVLPRVVRRRDRS